MSFRKKIILGLIIVEILLLLPVILLGLNRYHETQETQLTTYAHATIDLLAITSKDAMISSDIATLEEFSREALNKPFINYVRFRDTQQSILFQNGKDRETPFKQDASIDDAEDDAIYDISKTITDAGYPYGTVEIGFSTSEIYDEYHQIKIAALVSAAIFIIFISLLSWFLGNYLTLRLNLIEHSAQEVINGNFDSSIPVSGSDELATTATAFNTMIGHINHQMERQVKSQKMLESLKQVQDEFINGNNPYTAFETMLNSIMGFTDSKYGFISEIRHNEKQQPYLWTFCFATDHTDTDVINFIENTNQKGQNFTQLNSLLAETFVHGKVVIHNDVMRLSKSIQTDSPHPDFNSYIGIPLFYGEDIVGMIGLADRDTGYHDDLLNEIQSILHGAANLIYAYNARSEKELISQKLLKSQERFHLLTQGTNDGIWDWNVSEGEIYLSPRWKEMLDYTQDEIDNTFYAWQSLIHPDDFDTFTAKLFLRADSKNSFNFEYRVRKKDNQWFWVQCRGSIIRDSNNEIIRMVGSHTDISLRKDAERAQREATESALENAKIKAAFLANMSHEIRTPMNGVLGMLQLMANTNLDLTQGKYLATARASATNLLAIIDDILDFSKIEAGKLKIESVAFDLSEIIENTCNLLSMRAQSHGNSLHCMIPAITPIYLFGDPQRITQILMNLVGNAIKFTENGKISIDVEPLEISDESAYIRISVSDTGIGIDEQAQKRLFSSFEQADTSTSRKYGGTGLGLTISKQLVELMGGNIGLTSVQGEGTTFWFELPFKQASHEILESNFKPEFDHRRALIIENSRTIRTILAEYLEQWGIIVSQADSLEKARKLLDQLHDTQQHYHYIFIDLEIEEQQSAEFIRELHENELAADSRIIQLTNNGTDGIVRSHQGVDIYLSKPIRQSTLFDLLVRSEQSSHPEVQDKDQKSNTSLAFNNDILLVEDNDVNQMVATGMLELYGANVDIANNGLEAIDKITTRKYDLIFMDCQMPEMDGFEATRRIREIEKSRNDQHRTIIALTANAMESDKQRCIDAGMDDYLSKPFSQATIEGKLKLWLGDKKEQSNIIDFNEFTGKQLLSQPDINNLKTLMGSALPGIISKYIEHTTSVIEQLSVQFNQGDMQALRDSIHTIKGSSATMGASIMYEQCVRAEEMLRTQYDTDMLQQMITLLQTIFSQTSEELLLEIAS